MWNEFNISMGYVDFQHASTVTAIIGDPIFLAHGMKREHVDGPVCIMPHSEVPKIGDKVGGYCSV